MDAERLQVLQMIAKGTISAEEGERLLRVLEATATAASEVGATADHPPVYDPNPDEVMSEILVMPPKPDWAEYWLHLLVLGGAIAVLCLAGGLLIFEGAISGWWFLLVLPGLFGGTLLFWGGWLMRHSCWLYLWVEDGDDNFKLSLPIPFSWIAWGIKVARFFVPKLADVVTDDVLIALAGTTPEGIFQVEVDEAEGEHVQIYYG